MWFGNKRILETLKRVTEEFNLIHERLDEIIERDVLLAQHLAIVTQQLSEKQDKKVKSKAKKRGVKG